jgi:hypothetical protein
VLHVDSATKTLQMTVCIDYDKIACANSRERPGYACANFILLQLHSNTKSSSVIATVSLLCHQALTQAQQSILKPQTHSPSLTNNPCFLCSLPSNGTSI